MGIINSLSNAFNSAVDSVSRGIGAADRAAGNVIAERPAQGNLRNADSFVNLGCRTSGADTGSVWDGSTCPTQRPGSQGVASNPSPTSNPASTQSVSLGDIAHQNSIKLNVSL